MYTPYPENMMESIKKVEATRAERMSTEPRRLTADEKDALLKEFHPDYNPDAFAEIKVGPNKGQKAPVELAEMLHSTSRILNEDIDITKIDYDVDVLVIGGGGAGSSCAIEAHNAGANVMIVTKLRIGDANTMMAEGGIQAADKENDSPVQHYLDCFGGGHFAARPELVRRLVMEAPDAIKWLNELGVMFDKDADGRMVTTHGGGTSRKRMHACKDYSGAEIMRTLRDEVLNRKIPVVEFTSAVEIIKDEKGQAAGAVLLNMETGDYSVARAKTVVIATGGAGRMHYQGFPTSNHYGATADGLILGYRAGVPLLYQDSIQYHPTGVAHPVQLQGALVTEKLLGKGDMLFYPQGYPKPARVQGAFISDDEVEDVVNFLKDQNIITQYSPDIEQQMKSVSAATGGGTSDTSSAFDEYFVEAGRFIIEKDKASIGMLQRVFKIGFNRAARIMDQLCEAGVVGEEEGTKPRKVLMSPEQFESFVEEAV